MKKPGIPRTKPLDSVLIKPAGPDCNLAFVYCRGGCPKDRLRDPRDAGLSHFCAGYKKFFAHADASFRALANEWKNQQGGSHD